MPLNDTQVQDPKLKAKPYKASDFEGLNTTITPTGSYLWHLKYRIQRREKRLAFGTYPNVNLAHASALRGETEAIPAGGEDLGVAKQEQKRMRRAANKLAFAHLAGALMKKSLKERKAQATMDQTEWLLGMASVDFGRKPMAEITAPALSACL